MEKIHVSNIVYINPSYLVVKPYFEGGSSLRSFKQRDAEVNLKDNAHGGSLSLKAMTKVTRATNWLIASSKPQPIYSKIHRKTFSFRVNFITLTIPPQDNLQVSGPLFQKCLHTFLVYSRKYFYVHNYVWKMEMHKDGRLHCHIVTDQFIHYMRLRNAWNRILQAHGLLEGHFRKFNSYNPNSTDIHKLNHVGNVSAYLSKYMAKNPAITDTFKGRIWGCSTLLSAKNGCKVELPPYFDSVDMDCLNASCIQYKPIETKPDSMGKVGTIAHMFYMSEKIWRETIKGKIKDAFDKHRLSIRRNNGKPPPEYFNFDQIIEPLNIKTVCENVMNTLKTGMIQSVLPF